MKVFWLLSPWGGMWRDFYALLPGDLVGFCLIVKTNPRGCPGGQPPGKPMISA